MSFDLNNFDLDDTATDEVRDRIIRPISAIAVLMAENFGQESEHVVMRDALRRLLWARNQIWHCFVRSDAESLSNQDTTLLTSALTTIVNADDATKAVTQAISEFILQIDDNLPERVDKSFAYQYLQYARNLFLKSHGVSNA